MDNIQPVQPVSNSPTIAALIVTFNPSISDLQQVLSAIAPQVSRIILVDNNSRNVDQIIELVNSVRFCEIVQNQENLGIATALNQGFRKAVLNAVDWIITLDDDSLVPLNLVKMLYREYQRMEPSDTIGIVCPLLQDRKTGKLTDSKKSDNECITSGSLTNVRAWKAIGGFDEWLFIDGVDFDFSRRLIAANYHILECESVYIKHEIGDTIPIRILGITVGQIMSHSVERKYYQERNYPYIDYKLGTYNAILEILRLLKHLTIVLLWEDHKIQKIVAMLHGRRDALHKIRSTKG